MGGDRFSETCIIMRVAMPLHALTKIQERPASKVTGAT